MRFRLALTLLLLGAAAQAQVVYTVRVGRQARSPDGKMIVTMRVSGEGRPEYSILRNGRTVIDWSRLGFILADAPKLERNFELARVEQRSIDETWEQPWGERRFVRNRLHRAARQHS